MTGRLRRIRARCLAACRCAVIAAAVLTTAAGAPGAWAASYYFSAAGSDAFGNGSLANPWKSINKFNALNLNPGDSALFRAGDQFNGRMSLDATDSGTNAAGALVAPVRIGSYGAVGATTRAQIVSPFNSEGFVAVNAGGIELADLEFVSGGFMANSRTHGVDFITDVVKSGSLTRLQHLRVNNIVSRGFGLDGLRVWAHNNVGYNDVQIRDSEFYDNGYTGIYIGSTPYLASQNKYHANVLIERVSAHDNPGYFGDLPITGHGVIMANVDGGVIQDSVAFDNGKVNGYANGAIWTYESNAVVIQRNLAYGNRSPGGYDGGAYDLDGGVTNSIVQHNVSYDNDGAGLLLAEFEGAHPMSNNVFRYNLSVNDGRDEYGGITVWGYGGPYQAKSAVFHNNTIVVDASVAPDAQGAVWFLGDNHHDVDFFNNAFVALNGATLIAGDTTSTKSSFVGNSYWTGGGPIILEDSVYATVQAWAAASQQERIGFVFTGIVADPNFIDSEDYRVGVSSPLVDAARMPGSQLWPSWLTSLGEQDIAGVSLYQGSGAEIGAWEYLPADLNSDGAVDGADLAIWDDAFGAGGAAGRLGDIDDDNDTDGADFLHWQRQLGVGQTAALPPPHGASAVPEPAALALAGLSTALIVIRRRRSIWVACPRPGVGM